MGLRTWWHNVWHPDFSTPEPSAPYLRNDANTQVVKPTIKPDVTPGARRKRIIVEEPVAVVATVPVTKAVKKAPTKPTTAKKTVAKPAVKKTTTKAKTAPKKAVAKKVAKKVTK